MRKVLIAVAFLFTGGFIGVGGFVFVYSDFTSTTMEAPKPSDREIIDRLLDRKRRFLNRDVVEEMKRSKVRFLQIPKGFTFKKAADLLEREGLISSGLLFRAFAWLERGKVRKRGLRAGIHGFHPAMKPEEVFDALYGSPLVYVERITVPEGFNLRQIAARLEAKGICKKEDFLEAAYDKNLLKRFGIPGDRMEGYLFPDTYEFRVGEKPKKIITRMYRKFRSEWLPVWEQRSRELGLGRHKAVTLASIIEKETGQAAERELISSVFHNRMRLSMKLQTDPTTCYAIREVEGWKSDKKCDITSSNKMIRNKYNTYWVRGYPPGPIASPGRGALRAALYPKESRYLFFVSRNDGTHVFSRAYSMHRRLVQKWQQAYFRKKGARVTADAEKPGDDPTSSPAVAPTPPRPRVRRPRRARPRRGVKRSARRRVGAKADDDDDEF